MGIDRRAFEQQNSEWAITLHAYSDLTNVFPVVFLYLLKECYVHGTRKASEKFRALQQRVDQVLYNTPRPGPAVFIARCLFLLPIFDSYCEGFSHMLISSLRRFLKMGTTQEDWLEAKSFATQLFITAVCGNINHNEKILVKILEVFNVRLKNIVNFLSKSDAKKESSVPKAKAFVKRFIFKLIEYKSSYMTAVTLFERFSIRESGKDLLVEMMEKKQYQAAEKWMEFMGKKKPMLRLLIQEYIEQDMLKQAYNLIEKHKLWNDFPEVYLKGIKSSLNKLVEKGCWDVAEERAKNDNRLLEYLVSLAMEAGYLEKTEELCDKYSLQAFMNVKGEADTSISPSRYLHLDDFSIDEIIWVDEVNRLNEATHHLEGCEVVGLDCEWKPTYEKGSQDKVSIIQIASEKMVFILDLIKLSEDLPDILDDCLSRILHSPKILKLGYNFQCDIRQLADSYRSLECFRHYLMLLEIQNAFGEAKGGLSALTKRVLGAGLDKTRRESNWEQRPLTQDQLEYAALDAVVLIHIFKHIRENSSTTAVSEGYTEEWQSHVILHISPKKTKKRRQPKRKNKSRARSDEPQPSS